MSNLSQAQRNNLPSTAFCGKGRTYPILDQADVDAAARLIGKAADADKMAIRKCIMAKCKANNWDAPDAWEQSMPGMAGTFGK